MFSKLPVIKQVNSLVDKLKALQTLLGSIHIHKDYVEVVLPDNIMITGEKHLVIRTPNGKLMLNPRIPKNRSISEHARIVHLHHMKLLEKNNESGNGTTTSRSSGEHSSEPENYS